VDDVIEVSVVMQPRGGTAALQQEVESLRSTDPVSRPHLSYQELEEQHGVDPAHRELLRRHVTPHGCTVVESSAVGPHLRVRGSRAALGRAFGVELVQRHDVAGTRYWDHDGEPELPQPLRDHVVAVLGLRTKPIARTQFVVAGPAAAGQGNTALQVAAAYGVPSGPSAAGQTVALVELGGGYLPSDVEAYTQALGVPLPDLAAVGVDGGSNAPGQPSVNSADGEVALDIQVVCAVAQGAAIRLYFAPNTEQGFVDAVSSAAKDGCTAISVSWGAPEAHWTPAAMTALDQACAGALALGIPVFAASGDRGSADGIADGRSHADFPASSPNAVGCGGTLLPSLQQGRETAWNDLPAGGGAGGGAVSDVFPLPSFQQSVKTPPSVNDGNVRRTIPDLAADASPESGYRVLVGGAWYVLGGTSAVAPLIASLHTLLDSALAQSHPGQRIGDFASVLYGRFLPAGGVHDIDDGSSNGQYTAGPGYDAVTGCGSPIFSNWQRLLLTAADAGR
jgi:kumamolisin